MVFFAVDCICSYKEYLGTICYHAEKLDLEKGVTAENHLITCTEIYKRAMDHLSSNEYDMAFFYFCRCNYIIEEQKLRSKCSGARDLLISCLDKQESLMKNELLELYNTLIEDVKKKDHERKHLVAQQHELYYPDYKLVLHQKRQSELFQIENRNVNSIREKIRNTDSTTPLAQIPTDTGVSKESLCNWYNGHTVLEKGIAPPKNVTSLSFSMYKKWAFAQESTSSSSKPRRGMVNLGNTCYLNSVTQVLSSTPLGKYFLSNEYIGAVVNPLEGHSKLVNSFTTIIRDLKRTDTIAPVSPSLFKQAMGEIYPPFLGSSQQDGNEFLRVLLDGIHRDLNSREKSKHHFPDIDTIRGDDQSIADKYWSQYKERNDTVVVDTCAFQERSSLECPSCHRLSRTFAVAMGIEVPIPLSKGAYSVENSLAAYCKEELLDEETLYTCPFCSSKVRAKKQLLFYSLPKVLFITLKRFRNYGDFSDKILDPVFFHMKLDMSPFMCVDGIKSTFSLVGVVNHQGNMHGGHYTADCLSENGVWYFCSDERVIESKLPNFELAYMLCYVRES